MLRNYEYQTIASLIPQVNMWLVACIIFVACVGYDQYRYQFQKGSLPGPRWKLPFLGVFLDSINPSFEKYMAQMDNPLLCVSVFHKVRVPQLNAPNPNCHHALTADMWTSPDHARLCGTAGAETFFSPTSWVFLDGKAHDAYRRGLNGLFNRRSVEKYLPRIERIQEAFFDKFVDMSTRQKDGQPMPYLGVFKELMGMINTRTITGSYLSDTEARAISSEFHKITAALELVNFPIILPFTKQWYGRKATKFIIEKLVGCARAAKKRIANHEEVTCVLDDWIKQMQDAQEWTSRVEEGKEADESERPTHLLRDFADEEIAETLLSFYFAALDTSSSVCTWLFQLLADHPTWLARVRDENLRVRGGDKHKPISLAILDDMPVTRAVLKETLRFRTPAIALPRAVKKDLYLTPDFTAKKGQMLMPSVWKSTHDPDAYPEPDTFQPERWLTGDAEKQTKNWVVFGCGPHSCLGQQYAMATLMTLIGKASMMLKWTHVPTEMSEEIRIFSTIFPKDGCRLLFEYA